MRFLTNTTLPINDKVPAKLGPTRLARAGKEGKNYSKARYLFTEIQSELGKHFIGIVGPRGVGKTVILKQLCASEPDTFYLSADTLDESDLYQVARILSDQYKIRTLLVDEIHFCRTYPKDLKKIYDFQKIRLIFTSSVPEDKTRGKNPGLSCGA